MVQNPSLDNEEAMHRATTMLYVLNNWARVYMSYKDGTLTAEEVVQEFNNVAFPVGLALKLEMTTDLGFMMDLVDRHADLVQKLAEAEALDNEENEENVVR